MDIISWIREEQELDRLLFREGRNKMNFKKIGTRVVNLDNVTEIVYQPNGGFSNNKPCVLISYLGDEYTTVYKEGEPETFSQLMTWMDERPTLLQEES